MLGHDLAPFDLLLGLSRVTAEDTTDFEQFVRIVNDPTAVGKVGLGVSIRVIRVKDCGKQITSAGYVDSSSGAYFADKPKELTPNPVRA